MFDNRKTFFFLPWQKSKLQTFLLQQYLRCSARSAYVHYVKGKLDEKLISLFVELSCFGCLLLWRGREHLPTDRNTHVLEVGTKAEICIATWTVNPSGLPADNLNNFMWFKRIGEFEPHSVLCSTQISKLGAINLISATNWTFSSCVSNNISLTNRCDHFQYFLC